MSKDVVSLAQLVEKKRWEPLAQLLKSNPSVTKTILDARSEQLCHHKAMIHDVPSQVIRTLLSIDSEGLSVTDSHGMYPIHYAVSNCSSVQEVINIMLGYDADCLAKIDIEGNLPLHLALSSHKADESFVHFLIEKAPESLTIKNKQG